MGDQFNNTESIWIHKWLANTCVFLCKWKMCVCPCRCVCAHTCLFVRLLSWPCQIYYVGVCGEAKHQYVTLFLIYFPSMLSLLLHLHYTSTSLRWIKEAIKTCIHVSVKDMRHINSTHTMSSLLPRGGFYTIHICFVCLVFFKSILTCAHLRY